MECESERDRFRDEVRSRRGFLAKYTIPTVGGRPHQEYWIPAEDLEEFNRHIVGRIEVVRRFP